MAIASLYPTIKPSLLLDFANSKKLDPRVTFTRSTTATYYDGVTTAKAEENLLRESQVFLPTAWALTGANSGFGPEIIVNGTFDTNTNGWTLTGSGSTATVISGEVKVDVTSVSSSLSQSFSTVPGNLYKVTGTIVTRNPATYVAIDALGQTLISNSNATATANYVASGTTASVSLQVNSPNGSGTFDNISVVEFTPTYVTAPDGTTTATEFTADAANSTITQSVTAIAAEYTFSVYLRRVTGTGDIDIQCGGGTWVTQSITSSWARYTVTQTLTAGSRTPGIRIVTSGDQIEVWGAQLEQRSAATAYTPTTTQPITNYIPVLLTAPASVPRFDHNPTTGESLGLLVEGQRTNLILQSEDFDTTWAETRATLTLNSVVAPNGTQTADQLIASTDNDTHFTTQTFTGTAVAHTFTVYAKASGLSHVALRLFNGTSQVGLAYYNLSTGVPGTVAAGTASMTSVDNGWYRCVLTATLAASASCTAGIYLASADNTNSFAGNAFDGVTLWGAQLEAGAFLTSYIPTTSATVTRTADAASMTGTNFSVWDNAAEGAIYTETIFPSLSSASGVVLNNGTTSNRIRLAPATVSDQATVTTSGTAQAVLDAGTPVAGAVTRLAMAYAVNDFALSLNGGAVATDTSGTVPVVNQFQIGAETTTNGNVRINKIAYYPARLTNAQLQALTA